MIQALFIEYLAVWGVIKVNNRDRNSLTFFQDYGKNTKMNQSLKLVTCDRFKGFAVLSIIFFLKASSLILQLFPCFDIAVLKQFDLGTIHKRRRLNFGVF